MMISNIVVNGKNIEYGDIPKFWRFAMTDSDWQERAKGLLKSELKKRGIGYKQLADKLKEIGVDENDRNIANKLARGGFSAVFLLQCLSAIGCNTMHLEG
jgi:hypothetical protein